MPQDQIDRPTGRRTAEVIEITPEMIAAGAREDLFDSELIREHLVYDILVSALNAGGYEVVEVAGDRQPGGD